MIISIFKNIQKRFLLILDPHVLDDEQLVEIPNENATMESEKLKIWFGKEKNHDSPAGTGQIVGTPSLTLEDDTKAALLAKLRELDDGWEDNQKVRASPE